MRRKPFILARSTNSIATVCPSSRLSTICFDSERDKPPHSRIAWIRETVWMPFSQPISLSVLTVQSPALSPSGYGLASHPSFEQSALHACAQTLRTYMRRVDRLTAAVTRPASLLAHIGKQSSLLPTLASITFGRHGHRILPPTYRAASAIISNERSRSAGSNTSDTTMSSSAPVRSTNCCMPRRTVSALPTMLHASMRVAWAFSCGVQ